MTRGDLASGVLGGLVGWAFATALVYLVKRWRK